MRKWILRLAGAAALVLLPLAAVYRPDRMLWIGTGYVSHTICSGAFMSARPPEELYAQLLRPQVRLLDPLLRYQVDRDAREVTVTWGGTFRSRSVYHEGLGCLLLRGDRPPDLPHPEDLARSPPAPPTAFAGADVVEPTEPRLRAALDRAFTEPGGRRPRLTQAVVVVHDREIIAERYAPGFRLHTPVSGQSVTKVAINALVGILVRLGRLSVTQAVPVASWRGPGDPRGQITIDQLLRMDSGLPADMGHPGWDPMSRMLFLEADMAAFAERAIPDAAPGTRVAYSNRGYLLLSRLVRDAAGGRTVDVVRFVRHELFEPLAMTTATLEVDATGTPVGTSQLFASARDWARFGMLYLDDGMAGGRRILPIGWVRYSTTETLDTGYGASFWLNVARRPSPDLNGQPGMPHAPADTFFAPGYAGQYLVIVPSRRLVIVRLGTTFWPDGDREGVGRLVGDVVEALERPDVRH